MFDTIKTPKQCYDVLMEGITAVVYSVYVTPRSLALPPVSGGTGCLSASESSFQYLHDRILWPDMEAERVSSALRTQEARLIRQEEFQTPMASQMGLISTQLQDLSGQLTRQTAPAPLPACRSGQ